MASQGQNFTVPRKPLPANAQVSSKFLRPKGEDGVRFSQILPEVSTTTPSQTTPPTQPSRLQRVVKTITAFKRKGNPGRSVPLDAKDTVCRPSPQPLFPHPEDTATSLDACGKPAVARMRAKKLAREANLSWNQDCHYPEGEAACAREILARQAAAMRAGGQTGMDSRVDSAAELVSYEAVAASFSEAGADGSGAGAEPGRRRMVSSRGRGLFFDSSN